MLALQDISLGTGALLAPGAPALYWRCVWFHQGSEPQIVSGRQTCGAQYAQSSFGLYFRRNQCQRGPALRSVVALALFKASRAPERIRTIILSRGRSF